MPSLIDLPGTNGREIECEFATSVAGMIRGITRHMAATTAGDHGAVNVWVDDEGRYRSNFYRFMSTKDEQVFTSVKSLREWLKVWMPRMDAVEGGE